MVLNNLHSTYNYTQGYTYSSVSKWFLHMRDQILKFSQLLISLKNIYDYICYFLEPELIPELGLRSVKRSHLRALKYVHGGSLKENKSMSISYTYLPT